MNGDMMFFKRDTTTIKQKPTRLYLFLMEIEGILIVKCGKSSGNTSEKRFLSIIKDYVNRYREAPYARILRDVECVEDVFTKEKAFHHKYAEDRFFPARPFSGYTELFDISIDDAIATFDNLVFTEIEHSEKECYTCKNTKSTSEFHTNKSKKDGLNHECKECLKIKQRTKERIHTRMYSNQVSHSESRLHPRPAYTSEDLKAWLHSQSIFHKLYEEYKTSGYSKQLVPSVDRIDPNKAYTLDNIQLLTWRDNQSRNSNNIDTNKGCKTTILCCNTGEIVARCLTTAHACRLVSISTKRVYNILGRINKYGRLGTINKKYCLIKSIDENIFLEEGVLKDEYWKY